MRLFSAYIFNLYTFINYNLSIKLKYDSFRPVLKYNTFTRHLNYYEKFFTFFSSPSVKMCWKNIIFDDKNISKSNFYQSKELFKIDDIVVNKILVKRKTHGAKNSLKYFTGYDDDGVMRQFCIKLPQIIGYVKCFDSNMTMTMSFKSTDKKLFKKFTKIWERVTSLMNIEFDSEPVYGDNDKYIKTKIKWHSDKVNTNFQGKKVPKKMHHTSVCHW